LTVRTGRNWPFLPKTVWVERQWVQKQCEVRVEIHVLMLPEPGIYPALGINELGMKTNRGSFDRNHKRAESFGRRCGGRRAKLQGRGCCRPTCSLRSDQHCDDARGGTGCRRGALKRAEVTFVKRREKWWECPSPFCGVQVLFLMVGPNPDRTDPTCFCGNTMRRVVGSRGHPYRANGTHDDGASSRCKRRSNRMQPSSAKVPTTIGTGIAGAPLE
jgi:hypothetical protein